MIYIGIAGWALDAHAKPLFGEGPSHLARYATRFSAVEINSSFYRPHRIATYARWAASVPSRFRFAVKMPRTITHIKRLTESGALLDEFRQQTEGLGAKLGPVLIQLPPSLEFDLSVTRNFLAAARDRFPGRLVLEPRHRSWSGAAVNGLLGEFEVNRVEASPAPIPNISGAAGSRYLRWHGSPVMYRSSYDDAALAVLAKTLTDDDWCIFDNTAEGAAIRNGLRLQDLI